MPIVAPPPIAPIEPDIYEDDDEGWQDMPIVREDDFANGLDEEDKKKYHYVPPSKKDEASAITGNATGNLLDFDYRGNEWRSKADQNESEYTRLRVTEEDDSDEVHMRTKYLFNEDKAMTPLSQMQATKDLLTEAQRIAYVGLCSLTSLEMSNRLKVVKAKELKNAIHSMELWALKIMGRLYYHMELATEEQKMIESLALHGIEAKDLVPSLMTTHTIANPEYDPAEARKQAAEKEASDLQALEKEEDTDISESVSTPTVPTFDPSVPPPVPPKPKQTTAKVLEDTSTSIAGVSTHLSAADKDVTLDIRWTVLCDLFLLLVADSVYDARSRVLLENVALKMGLGWLDVVKFERRVTEALEIQESVEKLEQKTAIEAAQKSSRNKRYMMMGLATIGGGLVIGLSAGLLAPVIGAGLGAAFATVGISGTTGFLAGAGGAAVITTGGVLTGSGIAARGMANRTQYVRTFDILPLHNNKRVNCILTVPGFMTGPQDDPRLPFSVLDPVVGDVFSVLWEPEMIRETGSALKILTSEVLTQIGQTVLSATVMTALMSALQWPIILTKLGYLIDNPWSNALDRARAAGKVLADVLLHRHLGVRPITLIGFSLGARVIFYALVELAKQKAYGIVQDVFILGATVTAPKRTWLEVRSVISGRFVNGYARNDWVLNYLFRATSGGLNTVAGLRPVENVPGLENVDVTDKIAGHMSYRTFMPLILDQLGFPVSADFFDEPVEPDFEEDRIVVREGEDDKKKKSWFSRKKDFKPTHNRVSRPPSASHFPSFSSHSKKSSNSNASISDEGLPPREEKPVPSPPTTPDSKRAASPHTPVDVTDAEQATADLPVHAGFDLRAIKDVIGKSDLNPEELQIPAPSRFPAPSIPPPTMRTESAPPLNPESPALTPRPRSSLDLPSIDDNDGPIAGPSSLYHQDLSSAVTRHLSLDDYEEEAEEEASHTPAQFSLSKDAVPPTLTFGTRDGLRWDAPDNFSSPSYRQDPSLSSGELFNSSSVLGSSPLPPSALNPFASSLDSGSLSFGAADGTISFSPLPPVGAEQDPWAIGTRSLNGNGTKKPATALDLNPWKS